MLSPSWCRVARSDEGQGRPNVTTTSAFAGAAATPIGPVASGIGVPTGNSRRGPTAADTGAASGRAPIPTRGVTVAWRRGCTRRVQHPRWRQLPVRVAATARVVVNAAAIRGGRGATTTRVTVYARRGGGSRVG